MIDSERIHVTLSPWDLSDDYNRHAGVTLLSFLEHCNGEKVIVHLLYEKRLNTKNPVNVTENKVKYAEIAKQYGAEILYHNVNIPEEISQIPTVQKWTAGALLRLYLPNLLPDVEKIIYLDCDMVVNTDVSNLWQINIDKYPLAACVDSANKNFSTMRKRRYRKLGINIAHYFCSGMLLLNLNYIRTKFLLEKESFKLLKEQPDLPLPDQDILNIFFGNAYLHLPEKYNIYSGRVDAEKQMGDAIIHYAWKIKPWKAYHGPIDDIYWKYLLKTPWGKDFTSMIHYIIPVIDVSNQETIPNTYAALTMRYLDATLISLQIFLKFTASRILDFFHNHVMGNN